MVVTKALVERGFSFPPSDFFTEILKAYGLQPHTISPNSILAINNHVALCEGHLWVTPELSLFQYYFSVKKEKVPQTSSLSTCGTITFKLRPGRIYPHTDRHESARYWSGGFFYLKDVSDLASARVLPAFKDGPASETPAWTQCPHLSESTQLTRAHRDRLMFQYTGRDDLIGASKDNLSSDAVDKRIRVLIKIPRDLRIHVCNMDIHTNGSGIALENLEEKDLGTLVRVPHSGTNEPRPLPTWRFLKPQVPPSARELLPRPCPEACPRNTKCRGYGAEKEKQRLKKINTSKQSQPNIDQFFMTSSKSSGSNLPKNPKKKAKPSPASVPVTPEVEVPPKASSSTKPDPKDIINLDDLPEEPTAESGKGASSPPPPPEQPAVTSVEAPANDAEKKKHASANAHNVPWKFRDCPAHRLDRLAARPGGAAGWRRGRLVRKPAGSRS
ncbi:hypothetical protein QYE76_059106 [Lolium multiflorum]|uniref:Transposase (putative) gypsy type domain-containing protein n=1 Tax=Lolium multiflorum TaxID=4521 RepID=A0AAD8T697_LOLMU|nr:hypothetical protein QYE76_059106 [Lolium multiflorum]